MKPLRWTGLAGALLVLGACVHSEVFVLDPAERPPTNPDSVRLLGKEPQQAYAVVALVSAFPEFGGLDQVRRRLQREAARLGGHALLFDAESLSHTEGSTGLSAKVIVFDRPPGARPAPK